MEKLMLLFEKVVGQTLVFVVSFAIPFNVKALSHVELTEDHARNTRIRELIYSGLIKNYRDLEQLSSLVSNRLNKHIETFDELELHLNDGDISKFHEEQQVSHSMPTCGC